jgi:hypothetical protein
MSFTFVCAIAVVFLVMSLVGATESAPVFGLLIRAHSVLTLLYRPLSPSEAKSRVPNGVLHCRIMVV